MGRINLARIAHVYYEYQDLDRANTFLLDFGFLPVERRDDKVYYSGYGQEPFILCAVKADEDKFGGAAFATDTMQDLELAASLPGASDIETLNAPGGGKIVTLRDPVNNFPFHFVFAQNQISYEADKEHYGTQPFNYPIAKNRFAGQFQRFDKGPATIHKFGHFGLCTVDFAKTLEFFTGHFNFKPSDLIHDKSGKDVATFMHLDRGAELVDHHCFFFYEGAAAHVHHSSFEVHDFDTQALGHDWLKEKGYENCWGVGRHLLGSQIFDYWFDPSRFILEHYVDGDLVNCDTPIAKSELSKESLWIWGPEVPETFLE